MTVAAALPYSMPPSRMSTPPFHLLWVVLPLTLLHSIANLYAGLARLLPVWRRSDFVLEICCDRRLVPLHPASVGVREHDRGVVDVIRTDVLVDTEKASRDAVEEDVVVVSLVDLTLRTAALAMRHQCCG